jgi:hypothetical protein
MSEADTETIPEFYWQQLHSELSARSAFVNLLAELHDSIHLEHVNIARIQELLFQMGESWALRFAVDPQWNQSAAYATRTELDCLQTLLTIARYSCHESSGPTAETDRLDFSELAETFHRITTEMRKITPESNFQA